MTRTSSRDRLDHALARIADPKGEGARACLTVYQAPAREGADAADARARSGISLGPLDGVIVSIKDLFDVKGEPTRAGSKTLADAAPATEDAPVVRRLRQAGAVIVAKTNMSEFAFSGVGANPHYGTPCNPADRARVPGGSSSGAAVAAADGMCEIAIGTDTGGSTRIPAGLCGIVGYKPSKWRVSTHGAFPLSYTLDSIGPLARTVADCALADAVMAGEKPRPLEPLPVAGVRLGIPVSDKLHARDAAVTTAFAAGVEQLRKAGARVNEVPFRLLDDMVAAAPKGGFRCRRAMRSIATGWRPAATRSMSTSAPASAAARRSLRPTISTSFTSGIVAYAPSMPGSPTWRSTRWSCRRRRSSHRGSPTSRRPKPSSRPMWRCSAIPPSETSSIFARFRCPCRFRACRSG
jgi:aspartyl-tRNA(Asn)/glutamyl-tRNA(Gln) amidotransferase subunit A